MSRKEGERGLASNEDSVEASIWELEESIKKNNERIITAASNSTDNEKNIKKLGNKREIQLQGHLKQKVNEKTLGHSCKRKTCRDKLNIF